MGGKNRHTARAKQQERLDEFRVQITTWYLDECLTALDIQERLKACGLDLTVGQVHYAFHRYGLKRPRVTNSPKMSIAAKKRSYGERACKYCNEKYVRTSSMQQFCRTCVPNNTWLRRIHNFGISKREFDVMYANQGGKCGICKAILSDVSAAVDHDHDSGKIRGLLCRPCNLKLCVVEDESFVTSSREYLKCSETVNYGTVKNI